MFERFTPPARELVTLAQRNAEQLDHRYIGTEHLLLGMTALPGDDLAAGALAAHGVTAGVVHDGILRIVGSGPSTGLDAAALRTVGIDLDAVRRAAEQAFGPGALDPPATGCRAHRRRRRLPWRRRPPPPTPAGHTPFAPRAKKVFELGVREAAALGHEQIRPEHILLGILREGGGVAVQILAEHGTQPEELRAWLRSRLRRSA